MRRAIALTLLLVPSLAGASDGGAADTATDLALVGRMRTVLGDVQAFEHLNDEIVRRCHEPVSGAYSDWRDEFRVDLERAHALARVLRRRLTNVPLEPRADERLKDFSEAEGQSLVSRCMRWSTLLIQRESPIRAEISARFGFLRDNEAALRAILADDAKWQQWRAAGSMP